MWRDYKPSPENDWVEELVLRSVVRCRETTGSSPVLITIANTVVLC